MPKLPSYSIDSLWVSVIPGPDLDGLAIYYRTADLPRADFDSDAIIRPAFAVLVHAAEGDAGVDISQHDSRADAAAAIERYKAADSRRALHAASVRMADHLESI